MLWLRFLSCHSYRKSLQPGVTCILLIRKTHYDTLGVKPTATKAEIRIAFVNACKKLHPDVNQHDPESHDKFVAINNAYSVLSERKSRRLYDIKIRPVRYDKSFNNSGGSQYTDTNTNNFRNYETKKDKSRNPRNSARGGNQAKGSYEDVFFSTDHISHRLLILIAHIPFLICAILAYKLKKVKENQVKDYQYYYWQNIVREKQQQQYQDMRRITRSMLGMKTETKSKEISSAVDS